MQAIVHKVMHAFSFKHPDSDDDVKRAHREAAELATELLENYKQQLARQVSLAQRRQTTDSSTGSIRNYCRIS